MASKMSEGYRTGNVIPYFLRYIWGFSIFLSLGALKVVDSVMVVVPVAECVERSLLRHVFCLGFTLLGRRDRTVVTRGELPSTFSTFRQRYLRP